MSRIVLVLCAVVLSGLTSLRLASETRYVLHARRPVAQLLLHDDANPAGVVYVFQPEDCLSSGALPARWNAARAAGTFPVHAVVVGSSLSDRQKRIFRDLHIEVPTRGISKLDASIVAEKLGYRLTPFVVVLDARGRVAGSFPADQNVPLATLQHLVYAN